MTLDIAFIGYRIHVCWARNWILQRVLCTGLVRSRHRSTPGKMGSRSTKEDPSLKAHVIVMDGQIVGSWKRTLKKNEVIVQLSPFNTLTKAETEAVEDAAERFGKFLGLPVALKEP